MKKTIITFALISSLGFLHIQAQQTPTPSTPSPAFKNPPVSVEEFTGGKYGTFQNFVNKGFGEKTPFGVYSIVNYNFNYTPSGMNDIVIQSLFTVNLYKRLAGGIGQFMSANAFYPVTALKYAHTAKHFGITILPVTSLSSDFNSQSLLTIFQYKPKITEKVKLYSRFQMLNSWTDFNTRTYSYEQLRLGIEVTRVQFGVGITFQQFEKQVNSNEQGFGLFQNANVGFFVRKELFN